MTIESGTEDKTICPAAVEHQRTPLIQRRIEVVAGLLFLVGRDGDLLTFAKAGPGVDDDARARL